MKKHPLSPKAMIQSFWLNRHLVWQLTKREVVGRYRGSFMGILWSFITPLLMLAVYTLVFGVVLKARWNAQQSNMTEFAITLFAGLIIFNFIGECLNRAPRLILENVNYVKKVVFPLEILCWVIVGAALFHMLLSTVALLVFYFVLNLSLHWTIIFFPFVFIPFVFFVLGVCWCLASLGVYIRDVGQMIGVLVMMLMFLSPIFYPISALPESLQFIYFVNPLAFIIEQTRFVLLWGKIPHILGLLLYSAVSFIIACLGFAWFQKTRNGFADVM